MYYKFCLLEYKIVINSLAEVYYVILSFISGYFCKRIVLFTRLYNKDKYT